MYLPNSLPNAGLVIRMGTDLFLFIPGGGYSISNELDQIAKKTCLLM